MITRPHCGCCIGVLWEGDVSKAVPAMGLPWQHSPPTFPPPGDSHGAQRVCWEETVQQQFKPWLPKLLSQNVGTRNKPTPRQTASSQPVGFTRTF